MSVCLILIAMLSGIGILLRILHRPDNKLVNSDQPLVTDEECCGLHNVCSKINALRLNETIEYFDDEELDRFKGRNNDSYSDSEIDEFRDVMLTLLPTEIELWRNSIEKRGINMPSALEQEYVLLVTENKGKFI